MAFKLYYSPETCGGAIYVAASLAGLSFDSEQVSLSTRKTASGVDFYSINRKGSIPALVFNNGTTLTETVASFLWISANAKECTELLASPCFKTLAYYDFLDKLGYVNSEMHKSYSPLSFDEDMVGVKRAKQEAIAVDKTFFFTDNILGSKNFVMGDKPSVIDIYAYFVFTSLQNAGVSLSEKNPAAAEFVERIETRPQIARLYDEMHAASAP